MVMGSDEDPEDGGAVAASIFIAVAVYGVRMACVPRRVLLKLTMRTGIFRLLRVPSIFTLKGKSEGRYYVAMRRL